MTSAAFDPCPPTLMRALVLNAEPGPRGYPLPAVAAHWRGRWIWVLFE